MTLRKCESCGMPMIKAADFGGKKEGNRYCVHCTYETGDLLPRHVIRENMVKYYMKMKRMERPDSERYVDEYMAGMPAWG